MIQALHANPKHREREDRGEEPGTGGERENEDGRASRNELLMGEQTWVGHKIRASRSCRAASLVALHPLTIVKLFPGRLPIFIYAPLIGSSILLTELDRDESGSIYANHRKVFRVYTGQLVEYAKQVKEESDPELE